MQQDAVAVYEGSEDHDEHGQVMNHEQDALAVHEEIAVEFEPDFALDWSPPGLRTQPLFRYKLGMVPDDQLLAELAKRLAARRGV